MGEVDADEARYFLSSEAERAVQVARGYVRGLDVKAPSVVSLNATTAGLAVTEFAVFGFRNASGQFPRRTRRTRRTRRGTRRRCAVDDPGSRPTETGPHSVYPGGHRGRGQDGTVRGGSPATGHTGLNVRWTMDAAPCRLYC
jgi:hypothetical protein